MTTRTEDWTKDFDGMTSTCVVDVHAGETVRVSEEVADELELDRTHGREITDSVRERFVWEFPLARVGEALTLQGWSRASP